jgi:hypothetical protein
MVMDGRFPIGIRILLPSDFIPKPSHIHSDRDQNCLPVYQAWSGDIPFNER